MSEPQPADEGIESVDAERALLGLILKDDRNWWDVAGRLAPDDFFDERNGIVFSGMVLLADQGKPIGRANLSAQIKGQWGEFSPNAPGYVAYVAGSAPDGMGVGDVIDVVLHASGRRRLVHACNAIYDRASSVAIDTPIEEVRAEAIALIEAADQNTPDQAQSMSVLVSQVLAEANAVSTGERPRGIKTNFDGFDDLVGPMRPGQMIVLGGETGGGKTALATVVGVKVAEQGIPVHFTSLEMGADELAARIVSAHTGFSAETITDGSLSVAELERLFDRSGHVAELPIWIDGAPSQSVKTIQSRIARAQIRHGVKLAVIDHLQFIKPEKSKGKEHEEIRQVVDDVKAMAKRLKLPVILVSHVSRVTETWNIRTALDIRRPLLRDLYGSSAIEKAADAVIFVHRPQWFLERCSPGKRQTEWEADMARWAGKAELVLPKRRGGKGHGVKEVSFNESLTWFSD